MPIHWYPGHMATARREIREIMATVDLVIEVLDARLPFSSENPLVPELVGDKPRIRILNKADLADPAVTARWLTALAVPGSHLLTHHDQQRTFRDAVLALVKELAPRSANRSRPTTALILGVPNVGKSTLINLLSGRTIARTSNKPGVTVSQQRIAVGRELSLIDTPGFLWPKLSPEACGYRLALSGAISDRVTDFQDLAWFAARFLRARYPEALAAHYGLEAPLPDGPEPLLEAIGRRRGFLRKGGVVDPDRSAERLVLDLRDGAFGPVSLEAPEDR